LITDRIQIKDALHLIHGADPAVLLSVKGKFKDDEMSDEDKFCGERASEEQFGRIK